MISLAGSDEVRVADIGTGTGYDIAPPPDPDEEALSSCALVSGSWI